MFGFLKRLFGRSPSRDRPADPDDIVEEQWQANFSREDIPGRQAHVRFFITSENLYRAYLYENALHLGLKKTNCIAWTEDMQFRYQDLDMRGRIRLERGGGYAAAGFIFRMVDDLTYYMALVSNRGYFRLDLVRNSTPLALAGWTEAPGLPVLEEEREDPVEFDLEVIAYGSRILLLINGQWAGAWNDSSLPEGRIGFAAASYDPRKGPAADGREFAAEASLLSFSLDSRITEVGSRYDMLEDTGLPENRVRLAETFTALGQVNAALVQLRKAWEDRERAAAALAAEVATAEDRVVLAAIQIETPETYVRKPKELFLAAKLALALEQWDETEEYLEALAGSERADTGEELLKQAGNMKAAFLYSRGRYNDLVQWAADTLDAAAGGDGTKGEAASLFADPAALYNLLGHAYFNAGEYQKAAESYDRAGELDGKNGMAAKNAAASYELLNQNEAALERYLKAGRIFLAGNYYEELGLLIPKFRLLGSANWEARALIGKWSFGIEDWKTAGEELDRAEELRKETEASDQGEGAKVPAPDPALYFLQGLLLSRSGRRREALPLFEKAVNYAPDYPLFRFRLAENRFMLDRNPEDPRFLSDLEAALRVNREEEEETYGWVHNFAAHVALSRGDMDQAKSFMDRAAAILGEIPAVRVNRAVALYLTGSHDEALKVLESKQGEDPEGLMANCAGNLLVRSRRFEEADGYYRRALIIAPDNVQYRCNRASCLIELGRYGEADDVLTAGGRGISPETNPDVLELIAFVAVKKGEYKRAGAAALAALKIDPDHVPSLISLGWTKAFGGRWDELEEVLDHLDQLELSADAAKGRDDLERWMEEALYRTVRCALCGREWRVERNGTSVPAIKLYAMPPDDMPAGACPGCGKTYCVGCRKDDLDESGRFTCPDCGKTLKLSDSGLKALLYDWAETNLKKQKRKKKAPADGGAVSPDPAENNAPPAPPETTDAVAPREQPAEPAGDTAGPELPETTDAAAPQEQPAEPAGDTAGPELPEPADAAAPQEPPAEV
ncbi:MAG: tetratricopeptide repeat protein [Treponema sp.]|jgi:tetratricopeptide (TPR) repeat protein|nr:tetratricopeptide repeat protein [Treponema sp.]